MTQGAFNIQGVTYTKQDGTRVMHLELDGVKQTRHQWAKQVGIAPGTITNRLSAGDTIREALRPVTPRTKLRSKASHQKKVRPVLLDPMRHARWV